MAEIDLLQFSKAELLKLQKDIPKALQQLDARDKALALKEMEEVDDLKIT
ncbi:hypothetical protein [uncultured Tateyamaria sp.]|nr:hypothetical protein [uncultured Tateyamaria sp.]